METLLLLKQNPRDWAQAELVGALRASELVVSQAVGSLVAGGLAVADQKTARYQPASAQIGELVDAVQTLYATRPDQVRRMIVTASGSGINAFAAAFRLWKD